MKRLKVVAAIIIEKDKILCVQRSHSRHSYISKKFEFPGGKIEDGESCEQALSREIFEELNLTIKTIQPFLLVEHQYPDFTITLHSYTCLASNSNCLKLHEHIAHEWLPVNIIGKLDWAEADIPIVEELKRRAHELFN